MLAQGMFAIGFPLFALRLGARGRGRRWGFWAALDLGAPLGAFAATWPLCLAWVAARSGSSVLRYRHGAWPRCRDPGRWATFAAGAWGWRRLPSAASAPVRVVVATFAMRQRSCPRNPAGPGVDRRRESARSARTRWARSVAGGWAPAAGARWGLGVVPALHFIAWGRGRLPAGRSRVVSLADAEVMSQPTRVDLVAASGVSQALFILLPAEGT